MNGEYVHVERRILTSEVDAEEPVVKRKKKEEEEIEKQPEGANDKVGKEGCCCDIF